MKTRLYTVPAVAVEQMAAQTLMNPASPTIIQNGGSISDLDGDWTVS